MASKTHAAARRGAQIDGQAQGDIARGGEGEGEAAMTKATPGSRRGNTEASKARNALPLSARDNRILAQRLAYALRHPVTPDAVLIDIKAAELLLLRAAPGDHRGRAPAPALAL